MKIRRKLTQDQFFAPWGDEYLHAVAELAALLYGEQELDQEWSVEDSVMIAFSYLIRDGRLTLKQEPQVTER